MQVWTDEDFAAMARAIGATKLNRKRPSTIRRVLAFPILLLALCAVILATPPVYLMRALHGLARLISGEDW